MYIQATSTIGDARLLNKYGFYTYKINYDENTLSMKMYLGDSEELVKDVSMNILDIYSICENKGISSDRKKVLTVTIKTLDETIKFDASGLYEVDYKLFYEFITKNARNLFNPEVKRCDQTTPFTGAFNYILSFFLIWIFTGLYYVILKSSFNTHEVALKYEGIIPLQFYIPILISVLFSFLIVVKVIKFKEKEKRLKQNIRDDQNYINKNRDLLQKEYKNLFNKSL